MKDFNPDYLVKPGEILEEFLEISRIKKKVFAELCGLSAKCISEIISGKAAISVATAIKFEEHTHYDAQFWMNLETRYRIALERKKNDRPIRTRRKISERPGIREGVRHKPRGRRKADWQDVNS